MIRRNREKVKVMNLIKTGNKVKLLPVETRVCQAFQVGKNGTGKAKVYGDLEKYKNFAKVGNLSFTELEKSNWRLRLWFFRA